MQKYVNFLPCKLVNEYISSGVLLPKLHNACQHQTLVLQNIIDTKSQQWAQIVYTGYKASSP